MAKILVIDDDPAVKGFISKALQNKNHKVTSVSDGLEALGKIYSQEFDLAIIDVVLPRIHGTKLLQALKKHRPGTMVIMISGQADLEIAIESLRGGAFDFIKKPLRVEELEKVVDSALEEAKLMLEKGYVYKDSRRNDTRMIKKGIINAAAESILLGAAFFLAIVLQSLVFSNGDQFGVIGNTELIRMSAGLGFCYAFVFVLKRSHRVDLVGSGREMIGMIWRNLTLAYIMFLAFLFVGQEMHFSSARTWIFSGYLMGFLALIANKYYISQWVHSLFGQEGKKNIVIVGTGDSAREVSRQIQRQDSSRNILGYINDEFELRAGPDRHTRLIATPDDIDHVVITDEVEELYVVGEAFSSAELLSLLDRFKGRKLKIVILGGSKEDFRLADIAAVR